MDPTDSFNSSSLLKFEVPTKCLPGKFLIKSWVFEWFFCLNWKVFESEVMTRSFPDDLIVKRSPLFIVPTTSGDNGKSL